MTTTLEPGSYIDSHYGHYQTPMVIELAMELGYTDDVYTDEGLETLIDAYTVRDGEVEYPVAIETRSEGGPSVPDVLESSLDVTEHAQWVADECQEWINDHCLPEPTTVTIGDETIPVEWVFEHHPDLGDFGVWGIGPDGEYV